MPFFKMIKIESVTSHFWNLEQDNSSMSREAANGGIENSLWITKCKLQFHASHNFFQWMAWQAWWKKNPSWAAKPLVGDYFFTSPAKPFMGKNWTCTGIEMYLSWFIGDFQFLHLPLRSSCRNFPSPFFKLTGLVHS